MAFCSYCGSEMSAEAVACPKCGHPNEARAGAVAAPAGGRMVRTDVPAVEVGHLAGFWRRFVALLIDGIIIGVVTAPFGSIATTEGGAYSVWFNIPGQLVGFLYAWLMLALNKGQTLGKMALGIRITHPDGSSIDLGRSAVRAGMAIVSSIPFALGYLWAAWDKENRTWHDMVADTRAHRVPR